MTATDTVRSERPGAADHSSDRGPRARTELARLMDTTSGILSIQEALQHDRGLRLRHLGAGVPIRR